MFQGKTKNGVDVKSTLGMKSKKTLASFILVADRSRLRLFERGLSGQDSELQLKQEYINPEGRKKGHELVSDRPGRTFDSRDKSHHGQAGGTRHSYGSSHLPEDHAIELVVKEGARIIKEAQVRNQKNRIVLVAEPHLIGILKKAIHAAVPHMEITLYEKDYSWLNEESLVSRLRGMEE
jgi:protein required for attachment to host cells